MSPKHLLLFLSLAALPILEAIASDHKSGCPHSLIKNSRPQSKMSRLTVHDEALWSPSSPEEALKDLKEAITRSDVRESLLNLHFLFAHHKGTLLNASENRELVAVLFEDLRQKGRYQFSKTSIKEKLDAIHSYFEEIYPQKASKPAEASAEEAINPKEKFMSYAQANAPHLKNEEVISLSHGGGFWYTYRFLLGKEEGYPLGVHQHGSGLGIQVQNTQLGSNAAFYAFDSAHSGSFDMPAILLFKSEAQYLKADLGVAQLTQAGLTKKQLKNITDIKIINLIDGYTLRADNIDDFRKGTITFEKKKTP